MTNKINITDFIPSLNIKESIHLPKQFLAYFPNFKEGFVLYSLIIVHTMKKYNPSLSKEAFTQNTSRRFFCNFYNFDYRTTCRIIDDLVENEFIILDKNNPTKFIYRPNYELIEEEITRETNGNEEVF